ncbi:Uncharacterised protein [Vibrio cholerae]|nr:Uncharacterised protein [Vibrio cholerae]CSI65857.1 Uncharacterised protein [Vibrio cholerae]
MCGHRRHVGIYVNGHSLLSYRVRKLICEAVSFGLFWKH